MDLSFRPNLSAIEVEESIDRLEEKVRSRYPNVKHIFIESESLVPASKRRVAHG